MIIALPMPPSTNMMFINSRNATGKGRFPSPAYKAWKKAAAERLESYTALPKLEKPYGVHIRLNLNHQSDIANREKALCDALVTAGIICGDQWIDTLRIDRDATIPDAEIEVWSLNAAEDQI